MNCLILEDQPPAQRLLAGYLERVDHLHLVATFAKATSAMPLIQSGSIDLLFLDVHLPGLSGLDFLRTLEQPPPVILTTAFPDYALEGYDLKIVDYLLKPFSFQRFLQAINRVPSAAPSNSTALPKTSLFIKDGHHFVRIPIADILYIHSEADYTEIHLPKKRLISKHSLKHWLDQLPTTHFIRVHRSYIVHLRRVEKILTDRVLLVDKREVPVGRTFREELLRRISG
ncbi:MAG: LytTR family DNA-binding domain-containing protein [Bacteroidota bacterium]